MDLGQFEDTVEMNAAKKTNQIERFVREFAKEIEGENAAIFAGAGLSVPAGFVDWRSLLAPIAEELGLDVEREDDLLAIAQYHTNENSQNRSQLTKVILEEFSRDCTVTENHRILARLPISTYWTTNYDTLIEDSLKESGKRSDIKYTNQHLSQTKPKRDAIVYKMHGDIAHPDRAIITKDDYESYYQNFQPFVTALSGDLVEKTFLFVGFSFTDPNLEQVLSRIRVTYSKDQRRHYCLLRKIVQEDQESEEDFQYRKIKHRLFVEDLKRFNIRTIELDSYDQITEIFLSIERLYRRRTILISGAAHDYGDWTREEADSFVADLSRRLVTGGYRIVTGFGLGVGSAVLSGVLHELYMKQGRPLAGEIVMRPFPQKSAKEYSLDDLWEHHRRGMVALAGTAVFLFGNKIVDGKLVLSGGVEREFEIATDNGLAVVPVGATGWMAQQLWERVMADFDSYYPTDGDKIRPIFEKIGHKTPPSKKNEIILSVVKIITQLNTAQ